MPEKLESLLRGAVSVTTKDELQKKLSLKRPLRVKLGVDPTTKDLHLGHTVCLRKMRAFEDAGHTGVLIIGDFTGRIGDPSGRTEIRTPLTREQVLENAETYKQQAFQILDESKTEVRFNSEWLEDFVSQGGLLQYLPRVTLAKLTERDDFKARMAKSEPLTLLEIMYPVFQGYDSVAVKADVELGGTDQTFNLIFGRDIQRDFKQEPQVAFTLPILVGTDGVRKMSKTYKNTVALKDDPCDMFGKIMSVSDATMLEWAQLLTKLDLADFKKMHPKEAKLLLAETITTEYHGKQDAVHARQRFESVHCQKELPKDMPVFRLPKEKKLFISQVLHQSSLAPSRKEAQRKISEGAVCIDGVTVKDDKILELAGCAVLALGRRGFLKVLPPS